MFVPSVLVVTRSHVVKVCLFVLRFATAMIVDHAHGLLKEHVHVERQVSQPFIVADSGAIHEG